jgi:hypothetical protein
VTTADGKRLSRLLDAYLEAAGECEHATKTATLSYARREALAELVLAYAKAVRAPRQTLRVLRVLVADDYADWTIH